MKPIKLNKITFPENYSLSEIGITQSLIQNFCDCPRKFLLAINRWKKKVVEEKYLFGEIFHYILSKIYMDKKNCNELMIKILIDEYLISIEEKISLIDKSKIEIIKSVLKTILINYIDYYKDDFTDIRFIDTEKEFDHKLFGITFRGKIDGVFDNEINKKFILETKTKSQINENNIQKYLSFDFQGRFYCFFMELILKEIIQGFVYNIIRKSLKKPRKGESLIEFQNNLHKEIIKNPEYYFLRFEVPLTKKEKLYFNNSLFKISKRLIEFEKLKNPSNECNYFSCVNGNLVCPYIDLCIQEHTGNYYQTDKIFEELDCGY